MLRFFNTAADVSSAVVIGQTTETLYLDFKKDLDRWRAPSDEERRKGQMEFCRDVAQFANTFGGALLIGIEEGTNSSGVKVATAISPLGDFDGRRQWMEGAITNYLVPSTIPVRIERIEMPQGLIVAVNVPASERLVSVWDRFSKHTIEYLRRNNHGKEWMNPDEAEAHMTDTCRRGKLALRRLFDDPMHQGVRHVDLVSGVWGPSKTGPLVRIPFHFYLESIGEYEFKLRAQTGHEISIPYGLLREAWRTVDNRIGLFLHVRIISEPMPMLEPF